MKYIFNSFQGKMFYFDINTQCSRFRDCAIYLFMIKFLKLRIKRHLLISVFNSLSISWRRNFFSWIWYFLCKQWRTINEIHFQERKKFDENNNKNILKFYKNIPQLCKHHKRKKSNCRVTSAQKITIQDIVLIKKNAI